MNLNKDLNYQIIGPDSPSKLVFLHGILGRGRNWQAIAKKMSSQHQCLLYDQRGHGQSFKPESGYQLKDYAQDLRDLLDSIGWESPVNLVGHSMGGRVALAFAHAYPQKVGRLSIVDIGPTSNWDSMSQILNRIEFVPTPFDGRESARAFMEGPFMEKYQSSMLMEFFYSNLNITNHGYDWVFSKQAVRETLESSRFKDYWAEFKQLSMPTLLIRGELSQDLSAEDFTKVVAHNPNIRGEVVSGAGHWVHAERPQETVALLSSFFNIADSLRR
jgi:esterase